jgi:hypothetical protein
MKYDIKYAAREYESQGQKKTYWTTHGTVWAENGKMKIKLDSVPTPFDGWFQCFEQKTDAPASFSAPPAARPVKASSGFDDMPDDIPF